MGKGREAGDVLLKKIEREGIDIGIVQEPYHRMKGTDKWWVNVEQGTKVGMIVNKECMGEMIERREWRTKRSLVVEVGKEEEKINIINIYKEPDEDPEFLTAKIKKDWDKMGNKVILAGTSTGTIAYGVVKAKMKEEII